MVSSQNKQGVGRQGLGGRHADDLQVNYLGVDGAHGPEGSSPHLSVLSLPPHLDPGPLSPNSKGPTEEPHGSDFRAG